MKASARKKAVETDVSLLEAARKTLHQKGYSGFSTREVASTAGVPLSQIHYHFGSKQGLLLALFEYLNAQLLERQSALFDNRMLSLSERWDRACDYLDDDIKSGYVRILQELIAASWVDPAVARIVREGTMGWFDLLAEVARAAEREYGSLGPFKPEDIGALIGCAFMGAESMHLLGAEKAGVPVRQALRKVGDLIRTVESREAGQGEVMRAKLPDRTGFVDRDGVKIHYEVYGAGPETIVFIPPWSIIHSRVYKAQIPYFSERYRCITFDGRGNGKTDRPDDVGAYSMDNYLADVLAVMDATATPSAVLLGLSFGGMLSSFLAAHHPERVKAAILVGTSATIGPAREATGPAHFNAPLNSTDGWNKYNRHYWLENYPDFADFFVRNICSEPHSTKQIEDGVAWAGETTGATLIKTVEGRFAPPAFDVSEAMYRKIKCPLLVIHGDSDQIQLYERALLVAKVTGAELVTIPGGGHSVLGRVPAKCNDLIADFLERRLPTAVPRRKASRSGKQKNALYLSSPIGLGHGRRDIAVARELRKLHPGLQVDWLAQDPVTRLLEASGERIHPLSARLANESRHIEEESGEHDLHAFQAIRRMDEILIANFMTFQDAVTEGCYDLVIADEAWEIDHYWHEHPELKKAALAWFTDFVGFVPMPSGGAREAFLTADYNAEMIGHVEKHPGVRDRAIFVGGPDDIVPQSFGKDLPSMRDWIPRHFDFSGYIMGEHPQTWGDREALRERLGYGSDERVCIVTVGGSSVGLPLIRRILQSYPMVRQRLPELRMIVVTGPRIDPRSLIVPLGVEVRAFVPDLDRHLAACDLALVQGGLTTCMELTAAGTPFLYFPLKNHFEQNFHVAHRLERYDAGRRLDYDTATPDAIAEAMALELKGRGSFKPVEADGAARAARMIADLL